MSNVLITLPPQIINGLNQLVRGNWLNVATTVLVVYDWLITLDVEIQLVWLRSGWSHTKIVFLLNRYFVIFDFVILFPVLTQHTLEFVDHYYKPEGVIAYDLGIFLSEYILALRVCVVWKMNKVIITILAIANAFAFLYSVISYYLMLHSIVFFTVLPFGGCLANVQSSTLWISFVILLGYDTVILALMAYPTIKGYTLPYQRTDLVERIHVEGVLFYFYLLIVDIITVIIELTVPNNVFLFAIAARFLRSILASRVVLHIREYSNPPLIESAANRTQMSELRFE